MDEVKEEVSGDKVKAASARTTSKEGSSSTFPPPSSAAGSLTARLLDAFGDLQATSARLHAMQVSHIAPAL